MGKIRSDQEWENSIVNAQQRSRVSLGFFLSTTLDIGPWPATKVFFIKSNSTGSQIVEIGTWHLIVQHDLEEELLEHLPPRTRCAGCSQTRSVNTVALYKTVGTMWVAESAVMSTAVRSCGPQLLSAEVKCFVISFAFWGWADSGLRKEWQRHTILHRGGSRWSSGISGLTDQWTE